MKTVLLIAAGGALGAAARYGTVVAMGRLTGFGFPWGTVTVNLAGSLVLGLLIGALAHGFHLSQEARALICQRISEPVRAERDFILEELERVAAERGGSA